MITLPVTFALLARSTDARLVIEPDVAEAPSADSPLPEFKTWPGEPFASLMNALLSNTEVASRLNVRAHGDGLEDRRAGIDSVRRRPRDHIGTEAEGDLTVDHGDRRRQRDSVLADHLAGELHVHIAVSVPVGVPTVTVPASHDAKSTVEGAVMDGAVVSFTVTLWAAVPTFPAPSVAVH